MQNNELIKAFKQVSKLCEKRINENHYRPCARCKYQAHDKNSDFAYCIFKFTPAYWKIDECERLKLKR